MSRQEATQRLGQAGTAVGESITIRPSEPIIFFTDGWKDLGRLADFFAILAVFISCLGLFGLASYVAEQRTKVYAKY